MPPRRLSRHTFTIGRTDAEGRFYLSDRKPFRFRKLDDTTLHTVKLGDSLYTLAGRYYAPTPGASRLWWVIADFQPDPIHDPTLDLVEGSVLFVPSLRTVTELIFSETRRLEAT